MDILYTLLYQGTTRNKRGIARRNIPLPNISYTTISCAFSSLEFLWLSAFFPIWQPNTTMRKISTFLGSFTKKIPSVFSEIKCSFFLAFPAYYPLLQQHSQSVFDRGFSYRRHAFHNVVLRELPYHITDSDFQQFMPIIRTKLFIFERLLTVISSSKNNLLVRCCNHH